MLMCFYCGRAIGGECEQCAFAEKEQRALHRVQFAYQMMGQAEEELRLAEEELEKLRSRSGS